MTSTYLVATTNSTSGLAIRSMRFCRTIEEVRTALAAHGFPAPHGQSRGFPYRLRVYQTFADKSPKKLNEQAVRSLIGEAPTRKFPDSPLRCGDQLKYGQLKNLHDSTMIWVRYQNPETKEYVIDEPMVLKRSYTRGTKQDPVRRLTSTKVKAYFEYFEQPESRRNDNAHCVDADKMTLFEVSYT